MDSRAAATEARPTTDISRRRQRRRAQRAQPEENEHPQPQPQTSTSLPRACVACRTKKVRCDGAQPQCTACNNHGRECVYRVETPRKRPTFSQIHELQCQKRALESFIANLNRASPGQRDTLLSAAVDEHGAFIAVPGSAADDNCDHDAAPAPAAALSGQSAELTRPSRTAQPSMPFGRRRGSLVTSIVSSDNDDDLDIGHFISLDEAGRPYSFGPSSALHVPTTTSETSPSPANAHGRGPADKVKIQMRNTLIANAALQRQLEHCLLRLPVIEGVRTQLAMQLLDLHWTRQHHSFLLTYRPAIMRDLRTSGPSSSPFLLNAVLACSSKYTNLAELRDDPADPSTAGLRFFRRCDELLARDALLMRPAIPTVVGLLLLGSSFNSCGETSKGWLYTGYALRMVYDLGLHLDPFQVTDDPEEIEIRRRVFWGAFVCDKLQSLYLGRPVAMNLRDSHVPLEFFDLFEENEAFLPRNGGLFQTPASATATASLTTHDMPIHSVTTFQQLCLLSKITATIINRFYSVRASFSNAHSSLQQVDVTLQQWKTNLAPELDFEPWQATCTQAAPPNVMLLHGLYHSLIILLHRPFISDGHLRRATTPLWSWERCTAAARSIISIAAAYKTAFGLSNGPYLLGYCVYVACTIHVRNAASGSQAEVSAAGSCSDHAVLLVTGIRCLDDLCVPNPGVKKPARIIRRLADVNNVRLDHEEPFIRGSSMPVFDLDMDAILSMFPAMESAPGSGAWGGLDLGVPFDPLFGLMASPTTAGASTERDPP